MLPGRGTLQVIIGQCIITIVLFRGRGISQAYSSLGKEPRMSVIWSLAEATWCRARKKRPNGACKYSACKFCRPQKKDPWMHTSAIRTPLQYTYSTRRKMHNNNNTWITCTWQHCIRWLYYHHVIMCKWTVSNDDLQRNNSNEMDPQYTRQTFWKLAICTHCINVVDEQHSCMCAITGHIPTVCVLVRWHRHWQLWRQCSAAHNSGKPICNRTVIFYNIKLEANYVSYRICSNMFTVM